MKISLTNFFRLSNIVKPVVVLKGNKGFVVYQTRSGDNVMHEIKKDKESGLWTIISTQTWTGKKIFDMQDCIKKGTKKG